LFLDDSAGHSLMITTGGFFETRAGGAVGPSTPRAIVGLGPDSRFADSISTHHGDVGAVGQWRTTSPWAFTIRASASSETRSHRFGDALENDSRGAVFAEATATRVDSRNILIAGAAELRDSYTNAQVTRFDASHSTPGVFLQDTYSPSAWASTTANARCDWSGANGAICTPRLSLLVRQGSALSSRISAGAGWFSPRPLTDQTETFGLTRVYEPAPLAPERARTASMDITATRGPFQLNGTLFANRVANPVGLATIPGDTAGAVNLVNATGPLQTHGGELFAVFNQDPFVITAYYAATRSREVSTESGSVREATMIPREAAGLDFAADDDESGAYGAVEVFYTGRQALEDNPFLAVSRPYATIGILLSKRWSAAMVFVNGENLTNVRLTNFQPLVRPRVGVGGAWTVEPWAPLEGRRLNVGMRFGWP
jgi:iron complex outermembrane receptor protein